MTFPSKPLGMFQGYEAGSVVGGILQIHPGAWIRAQALPGVAQLVRGQIPQGT